MRLTIKGKTGRHKELVHMSPAASWSQWNSPTTMALKVSNADGSTGDVVLVLTKREAISMVVDILKQAERLDDEPRKEKP